MPKRAPEPVMRVVLTRDLIVHTAVGLVEREGPQALSMRAVAAELGVTAMAMYNHVPNKDALVRGIAEYVMSTLELPAAEPADWRSGARDLVRAFRRTAEEYPRCMSLVVASKSGIPVGLRAIERALSLCARAGLDGPASVRVMRALMAYTLGFQLREAGLSKLLREPDAEPGGPDALTRQDPDGDFEFGLDLFLSSVEEMGRRAT
ncbi:TetR/AcrR family transcriptional regulator C-terminal domain-containing protein [Spirillospora sp. NPDC029432]|uniref:TetR/AcrR family transcriptional regulator n=1 Tax=Spirillospora sp. NPDC029432 TaxID=3154599 RepID=UPI0034543991